MNVRVKTKILIAVVALAAAVGLTAWYKVYRDVPQPGWIAADPRDDFLYGWVGSRDTAAMPYWIWLALPRMFPEHLHGAGGYLSVGMSWEETREMPAGFAKKTLGYTRVAGNCALCHAASYRKGPDEGAVVVPAVPGHTTDLRGLFSFFRQCAQDPRFNADEILAEVDTATKLSLADRLLYRYLLIPRTRRALLKNDSMIVDSRLQRHGLDPSSEAPSLTSGCELFAPGSKASRRRHTRCRSTPHWPPPASCSSRSTVVPVTVRTRLWRVFGCGVRTFTTGRCRRCAIF